MAIKAKSSGVVERLVPILLLSSIVLSFTVGVLWQKVKDLEKGGVKTAGTTATDTGTGTGNQVPPPAGPTQGKLTGDQVKNIPEITDKDHIQGSKNAKITLLEYSDFECPFCQRFHPTVNQALDEYKDKIRVVYRHFPLEAIHPKARPAAEASECIFGLGGDSAFWKFVDEVFSANQQTALADLAATAVKVGVNKSSFQSCFDAKKYSSKIDEQYQGGVKAGVTGTPGNFVLNDKGEAWVVPGAVPYETLKATMEEALNS